MSETVLERPLVRDYLITRTESIPLHQACELAGPEHGIIRNCG